MPPTNPPPNVLAELYDSLFTMLETLPPETHPAWELAIESVIFGGEGIAPGVAPYGEQQSERNDFKISAYRERYGDGERVTEFPALPTQPPHEPDQQNVDDDIQLPVSPVSGNALPLFVDDDTLPEAIRCLNAFPEKPGTGADASNNSNLLNPHRFPGLSTAVPNQPTTDDEQDTEQSPTTHAGIQPNELADLYDGLYTALKSIPEEAHPRWKEAIESVLFDGEYLAMEAIPYGEQQAERNEFGMPEYRSEYGDGTRVTEFPAITTEDPAGNDGRYVDWNVELPVTPDTQRVLPLTPAEDTLPDAAELLAEFPAEPDAEAEKRGIGSVFDKDAFLADIDVDTRIDATESQTDSESGVNAPPEQVSSSSQTETENSIEESGGSASATKTDTEPACDGPTASSTDSTVIRQESTGESAVPLDQRGWAGPKGSRKHDDPEAERAHRRAQQRDPSDVVELGEKIRLTLKQVDYSSYPPTVMGSKNKLVVFVIDVPQDLSEYQTIKARVVDYGGKNNSAEAAFLDYVD